MVTLHWLLSLPSKFLREFEMCDEYSQGDKSHWSATGLASVDENGLAIFRQRYEAQKCRESSNDKTWYWATTTIPYEQSMRCFILLKIIRYLDWDEKRFPNSSVMQRHPNLHRQLTFQAAFLHDVMKNSWSVDLYEGGAEWKVRVWRLNVWPSLTLSRVNKNSITNHLYNANNAQISTYLQVDLAPTTSQNHAHLADFNDPDFIRPTSEGLQWMEQSQLLTNDSLYVDGKRSRFVQASPDEWPTVLCDATVRTLFTYNQLAGIQALRYLSRANEDLSILGQCHGIIRNLIMSTYDGRLGLNGIIQDHCDRFSNCTQDMQIFKGLPFLDIKGFCEKLDYVGPDVQASHRKNCSSYREWIRRNAAAAHGTVNQLGDFGSYWGSDPLNHVEQVRSIETQVAGPSVMLISAWFEKNF
ncbi:uncharacterized protein PV06_11078 [Exophiala oligosperma]|uniref:Uncharacterized protein n=1 Tax=Exophiala oligosperma TaxID=215243 RepID=A0A0D2D324_9EURO|nr:uncharacterized protein PV06_11078 [Exophiala oligosperma]KIW36660.1 hypothetical protein PV06_11078 [Exophiala oligosperma]